MSLKKIFNNIYPSSTQNVSDNQADWNEPIPLRNELLEVKPFHDSNFPAPFRDWILDVAERMQCPPEYIVVTAIVVCASLIGTGCSIKPKQHDDWMVVPNLWGGLIGHPGRLKTPAVAEVMQVLSQLEAEAKKAHDADIASYLADLELYKADRDALADAMKKASRQALKQKSGSASQETLSLKEQLLKTREPKKPIWKRYKTNDATVEKITELLSENQRGLLIYRDELIGLLSSWDKDGRENDRSYFLETWNGHGSLTTDRIGRSTVHTDNLCLSIFGNIQPARLMHYIDRAIRGNDNDGLLQRFQLLIYPDPIKNWQLIDRKPNLAAKERAFSIFKKLASMNYLEHGAIQEAGDQYPYFRFDDSAQEFFNQWSTMLESKLKKDEQPVLLEHLSKYRSLFPSLALIFHLISIADGEQSERITVDKADAAWVLVTYLETHARRIYGMANSLAQQAAIKLGNKILDGELTSSFTVRDVYRKEWTLLENRDIVQKACEELVDADWLCAGHPPNVIGRPKSTTYLINPKLTREKVTPKKSDNEGGGVPD